VTINYQAGADVLSMSRRETSDIKYIVLHHSATTTGNVAVFRDYHIHQLGFADVGYHYVICNGQGGPDGEVQPGRPELMTGAHAPGRNADSIGVCLVGDFTQGKPTTAQMLAIAVLFLGTGLEYLNGVAMQGMTPEQYAAAVTAGLADPIRACGTRDCASYANLVGFWLLWLAALLTVVTGWEYFVKSLPFLREDK